LQIVFSTFFFGSSNNTEFKNQNQQSKQQQRFNDREQTFHHSGFSLGRIIFAAEIVAALPVPTESQSESLGRLPAE